MIIVAAMLGDNTRLVLVHDLVPQTLHHNHNHNILHPSFSLQPASVFGTALVACPKG